MNYGTYFTNKLLTFHQVFVLFNFVEQSFLT